jgi:hypothetical protein
MEDGVKNLLNVMAWVGVEHQAQMHVMSELHDGRENWAFTERDMKNRYVSRGENNCCCCYDGNHCENVFIFKLVQRYLQVLLVSIHDCRTYVLKNDY